ncbi:MAG TPA: glycoside hydrolase family 44 protein [Pirellulales bacterium]|nr:glycoside hydrolase family 44 protein [Pirellulales bacterium]
MKQVAFLSSMLIVATSSAAGQAVNFAIDPTQGAQAISPYIYGINPGGANQSALNSLNPTFERLGGNRWTAYNWTTNASNAGSDYLYENDNYLSSSTTPGAAVTGTLQDAASRNAGALITIPTNGYVSNDESGPVDKSIPPSQSPHFTPEYPTASADPAPAANHVYQDQFVSWAKTNFPNGFTSGSKQPIFFSLDNEPDLWSSTHPEVHPNPATYAEMVQKSTAYAAAIKSVAPNALVYGPANYGWEGYLTLQNATDSSADNGATNPNTGKPYGDFISYYLAQMKTSSQSAGTRLLDALDVHWYPEATGLNASGTPTRITGSDTSPGVVAARLQAPRSLWDPNYVESSWITQYTTGGKGIQLIPRLQGEINTNYAGTKLSISEYNYGAGADISGGIAEADVLGIFGKQGMFSANEWPLASKEPFILGAMEMFRNFDGKNAAFGDTSISATNSDIQDTSVYASKDSTTAGRLVIVALNKTANPLAAAIALNNTGQTYTSFSVYRLTSASALNSDGTVASPAYVNTYPIAALSNFNMPGYSINTLVPMVAAPAGTIYDWNTSGASATDWTAGVNWTPDGPPGFGLADIARFGKTATIGAGNSVYLNANQTIAQLINQNANAWTLASGGPATSAITLREITQSSSAGLTINAPIGIDGTNQLTFDGAGSGSVTINGTVSASAGQSVNKSSPGTLIVTAAPTLGAGSHVQVSAGTLRFNVTTGTASVGAGAMATVASGATLELAGAVSALSSQASAASRVAIANNSQQAAGGKLLVSGQNQQVGGINGMGDTVVNSGASLTADHIIQNALVIGGAAGNPALVTIAPSNSDGSPMTVEPSSAAGESVSGEFLGSSQPFAAGLEDAASINNAGSLGLTGAGGSASLASASGSPTDPSAPEPSTLVLLIIGSIACRSAGLFRRRHKT